jgi:hypothetical protein
MLNRNWAGPVIAAGGSLLAVLLFLSMAPVSEHDGTAAAVNTGACPSVIMFDGPDITKDTNEDKARYWGDEVGVDGFLLNHVMASWETTVPNSESSPVASNLKRFQELYARHGVDQNFIKVAIYKPLNWKDQTERAHVVDNFRRGAELARLAGMRGMALDLESYVKGFWETDAADPAKGQTIYEMGKAIGDAIERGYPGSPVFIVREVLWWAGRAKNYALSGRFWDGFVASSVPHIYVGEELTYDKSGIPSELLTMYRDNAVHNHVDPGKVEIVPGLWPLGHSYTDKSPRMSVETFGKDLKQSFGEHTKYVWIYGFGSAWETDGSYGKGPVTKNFNDYVRALHNVKSHCAEQNAKHR